MLSIFYINGDPTSMIKDKESLTKTSQVLLFLLTAKEMAAKSLAYPSLSKALYPEVDAYYREKRFDTTLRRMIKQGWIRTEYREAKKVFSLTNKGELEAFFQKAISKDYPDAWDEKWRIVMFDIPEAAKAVRQRLRLLLRSFGFLALQASVYVYPYGLSGDAITFLKKSGLMRYIRIARADFDDDTDLRKLFKLSPAKKHGRLN